MSASVTNLGNGTYRSVLTDNTRGWSESTTFGSSGTGNTAEAIVESPSINGVVSLADFGNTGFTSVRINNASLAAVGAQNVIMTDNAGQPIALPFGYNGADAFNVTYCGGIGATQVAYQGSNGDLFSYTPTGAADLKQPMMHGTSPSIEQPTGGGFWAAYQAPSGQLSVRSSAGGNYNLGVAMSATTSPAITNQTTGNWGIAVQAPDTNLWSYASSAKNMGLGMMAGTSPSIEAPAGGGFWMAFQANTGVLWVASSASGGYNQNLAMAPGSSPSIVNLPSSFEVAYRGSTGTLWMYNSSRGAVNTGLTVAANTSPSLAAMSNGTYEAAFQGGDGTLYTYSSAGTTVSVGNGYQVYPGSSPAIVGLPGVGFEIAWADKTDTLCVTGAEATVNTQQQLWPGTSPSIAV